MAGYGRRQTTSLGGGDWPASELHARTDSGVMAGVGASDGAGVAWRRDKDERKEEGLDKK